MLHPQAIFIYLIKIVLSKYIKEAGKVWGSNTQIKEALEEFSVESQRIRLGKQKEGRKKKNEYCY